MLKDVMALVIFIEAYFVSLFKSEYIINRLIGSRDVPISVVLIKIKWKCLKRKKKVD
jgi:hypothetical protein